MSRIRLPHCLLLSLSADGLSILRKRFTAARDHLAAHQVLNAALVRFLHIAASSAAFTRLLPPFPSVDDEPDPAPCLVPSPPALLAALDEIIEMLDRDIKALQQRERAQDDALFRSLAIPAAPAADKLLRYEKALSGRLTRAIHELNRLQARRLRRDEF